MVAAGLAGWWNSATAVFTDKPVVDLPECWILQCHGLFTCFGR